MDVTFLTSTLSLFFLMTISVFVYLFSKKINFPYTVLLLIVGLLLIPISKIELFSFINHFELTPQILFYVFLPILLFESAYNMNYRHMIKSWKAITILAVFGLLISTIIIAVGMYYILPFIGFNIPFLVCLLFGGLISATDPVAVLSIFKSLGAPKRLTLIFEGESLFNDGTALALFLVILGIILEGSDIGVGTYLGGIGMFLQMAIGGIIFGTLTGVIFSKVIEKVKNNEMVEITLTMVLAHFTFVMSEMITEHLTIFGHSIHISGVIATTFAGIIIGNYGRYKISPKVETHMNQFWEFFAFISNSLVFILMGLILSHIKIDFIKLLWPSIIVIVIVMIARSISIYLPIGILNATKTEENIPKSWQFLLSWGSLRGALALMMALMIPGVGDEKYGQVLAFQSKVGWTYDFDIRDFVIVITIMSIMFTLFIKATTIGYFMRKSKVTDLSNLEKFEYYESKILAYLKIIEKINNIHQKLYLSTNEVDLLKIKYENKLKDAVKHLKDLLKSEGKTDGNELILRALSLHALGMEKQYLKDLFTYNEISEKNFKYILTKISRQIERLEEGKPQLKTIAEDRIMEDIFQKIVAIFSTHKNTYIDDYVKNRTKVVISRKVVKELTALKEIDFGFDKTLFDEIIEVYQKFFDIAKDKKDKILQENKHIVSILEARLVNKSLVKLEENIVDDLYSKEIINTKLYNKFKDEIDEEIYSDIKQLI